jgi:hypothetical protein
MNDLFLDFNSLSRVSTSKQTGHDGFEIPKMCLAFYKVSDGYEKNMEMMTH